MSCLRLGLRLPLPRRAWKLFTTKLQKKLPIFRLSKPRNKRILGATTGIGRPSITYPVQYKTRKSQKTQHYRSSSRNPPPRRFEFKKRHAPVFVDKLYYNEGSVLKPSTGVRKLVNFVDKSGTAAVSDGAGTSCVGPKEDACGRRNDCRSMRGDDMWESVVMESPQMHEIDERAEEFIAKFRKEMLHQESMAKEML